MFGTATSDKAFMFGPPNSVRSEEFEIVGTGLEMTNDITTFTKATPIGSRMWYRITPNLLELRANYVWTNKNGASGTNAVKLVISDPTLTALIPNDARGVTNLTNVGGIDLPGGYTFFNLTLRGHEVQGEVWGVDPGFPEVVKTLQAADFSNTGGILGFGALIQI